LRLLPLLPATADRLTVLLESAGEGIFGIDVVLLHIAMPQRDGLDVLRQIRSELPRLPVLMLSTCPDRQYAVRSLKLGAAGCLNKRVDSEQLIETIRKAARGQLFITPSVGELLTGALTVPGAGEIAQALVLAANTVSTYRARILDKTGLRTDVELALYAVRHGLL
jgi:DNA-binding NarL/FixJ family response regulator